MKQGLFSWSFHILSKNIHKWHFKIFCLIFLRKLHDIPHKLSSRETICTKCQDLLSRKLMQIISKCHLLMFLLQHWKFTSAFKVLYLKWLLVKPLFILLWLHRRLKLPYICILKAWGRPRWLSWMCIRLVIRRLLVWAPPGRQLSFVKIWNIFYRQSLSSADSRIAVVSFWWKNVHNTSQPLRGLSLSSKIVAR